MLRLYIAECFLIVIADAHEKGLSQKRLKHNIFDTIFVVLTQHCVWTLFAAVPFFIHAIYQYNTMKGLL